MNEEELNFRLAQLSPAKRALLELKLSRSGAQNLLHTTIPRRGAQNFVPLSFAQQRLWFLNQLEPQNSAYNEAIALRLEGELNVDALNRALNTIVERHEVLRTNIGIDGGGCPIQIIGAYRAVDLPLFDFQGSSEDDVQGAIAEIKRHPFSLDQDMMLRAALFRTGITEHIFVIIKHHIVSDAWSSGVFSQELAALYHAYSEGQPNPLPPLPIQYADYAVWQRQQLQGAELERQVAFWKEQLRALPTLELPTDRPRPPIQTYRGARKSLVLPQLLAERLAALSRQENATLFMTLLAAFQILLHRYSGQDDIAVGSPIAGRTRVETESLIGCFVNTLVYRNHVSGNQSFKGFLAGVREGALKAYEHQDLPFEKLVEELNPERSMNHSPLFQVLFAVQNMPREKLAMRDLTASPLGVEPASAKFDLFASFGERDGQLLLRMEYNSDLFNADTIERMLGHYRILLEGIVADADRRIADLPLLSKPEEHQLLVEWKGARQDSYRFGDVISMFEKQVERTPNALALAFEDTSLTYDHLNRRANQVAHYLVKQGVRRETRVAICMERSLEFAIGVLAILKAGGVYVPLDPSYPRDRLTQMMWDLRPLLVITIQSQVSQFSSPAIAILALDAAQESIAGEEQGNLPSANSSESAAYVLYTSGSTGKPKGVVMSHGALGNLSSWQIENLSEPSAARTLQFAPFGFDVSIQEMLATWCSGGSLFLIEDEVRRDTLRLLRFIQERSIERVFLPFVALQNLAEAAAYGNCYPRSLREIITAGEQLQMTVSLRAFLGRLGNCRLRNQYGPTETHVATQFVLDPPFPDAADLPPIGRPIANTEIYILDSQRNPVPIGVPGEIYIGGAGLACGYLNQPEITAEKFIDWSFHGQPIARLYKSGDRGRYLPDGNIEFLGRMDHQVKVRGFRIELGEIETILYRHPDVCECAVAAREDDPGKKRLVAYVVGVAGTEVSTAQLREFLREQLPEYMVPSAFVLLDSLPTTPSGKVDRRALPVPDRNRPDLVNAYVQPQNPSEVLLAKIWSEVLKLEKVGIHDNFFDLGGHSLMATMVMSRIREVFRLEPALRALFETPTIAGLSAHIEALRSAADENPGASQTNPDPTEAIVL
jgi:amino acid adenylation domain-containing protein